MEFGQMSLAVSLVSWSVLLTGHLQASPEVKTIFKSNRVLDLDKPVSIEHRIRRKRTAATAADQLEILRIHNTYRQKEGASDMYQLRWNGVLARMAETWATRCSAVHGQPSDSDTASFAYRSIGQNLFVGDAHPVNLTAVIVQWFDEKPDYFLTSNSCKSGKMCGHYTQIVWAITYEIGCGFTVCRMLSPMNRVNSLFLVCNYGPAGNTAGMKPFQIGPACTNCSSGQYFCNNGLCDNTCTRSGPTCNCAAVCQNCGSVTSDCSCSCSVGWTGSDCSGQCKNYDARCGGNPGWPASKCSSEPSVSRTCPAMCGKCVAGSPLPCVKSGPKVQATVPPTSRPDSANLASSTCLCVQGTNVAVRSTSDLRSSVVRMASTNDCFRSQRVVSISYGRRSYKVNAVQGNRVIDGWIEGQHLQTDASCPAASSGATCSNPNQRFANSLATCCLEAGFVWRASAEACADSDGATCPSFSNIRCRCLEELILFRRNSEASTIIVRGTETAGGDRNHTTGYMLSLDRNQAISYYVSQWFKPAGFRASDGARQWTSPRGNTWILGASVWDVYCP